MILYRTVSEMVCKRCGKTFDETKRDYCSHCRTVHTADGKAIRDLKGMLCYLTRKFGAEILLDRRRADALFADFFPKEESLRKLCFVALFDGCAQKLYAVREKPFEVRCAAATKCVKSLRDEVGIKGRVAAEAVEAVGCAVGCEISFKKSEALPASETESKKNVTDAAEQYSLGRHFDRLHEYDKALYWFESAALQDFGEAECYMGLYRLEGRGGVQNVDQAREWFVRAAENGVAQAEYYVGYFYAEGIACAPDENKAYECFLKAAKKGCEEAIEMIALCYENGVHVNQDKDIAKQWRKHALTHEAYLEEPTAEVPKAVTDDGEALYQSARRCLAEKDYEGAAMFYKRAAELGHIRAQCSYGKCLYTGNGVAKDYAEAFRYFRMAADGNSNIAQYNLGVMYLKGVYVPKDPDKAREYFTLAAANGHEEAEKILKKLK